MMFFRTNKNLKFILKIQYDDEENALINKVAPVLNQLSMEETSLMDDFFYTFFTNHAPDEFDEDTVFTAAVGYLT
jgi:hypothetical protein